MRSTLTLLLCLPVFSASAQGNARFKVTSALAQVAMHQKVTFRLDGNEWRSGFAHGVTVTVAIDHNPALGSVRMEAMSFEGGSLKNRIAGDGVNVWFYDVAKNTYYYATYGNEQGGLKQDWKQRLFQTSQLRSTGALAFAMRLVSDAFGPGPGSGAVWTPWIPTAMLEETSTGVRATASVPHDSVGDYTIDQALGLTAVRFDGTVARSRGIEGPQYDITVSLDSIPDDTDFGFVAPKGSKAVAMERRQRN